MWADALDIIPVEPEHGAYRGDLDSSRVGVGATNREMQSSQRYGIGMSDVGAIQDDQGGLDAMVLDAHHFIHGSSSASI